MAITPLPAHPPALSSPRAVAAGPDAGREAALRAVATRFEAAFLAQMLTHAGVGRPAQGFDGGPGEEAFRGHLVEAQARLMAEAGGIGLSERIFESLVRREGGAG